MKSLISCLCLGLLSLLPQTLFSQLGVLPNGNAVTLANTIVGAGISVSNASIACAPGGSALFSNGGLTNIGLDNGVLLTSGSALDAIGPNTIGNAGIDAGAPGDADLNAYSGYPTEDACVLFFDFEAVANSLTIRYVFASEEYPEWVGSQYNDVFAFLVSGPNPSGGSYVNQNIALIPSTATPVAINTVNHISNTAYYTDNSAPPGATIQYDGFTVALTATLAIVPCETYHIKLGLGDASDGFWDSGVFIEEASFEAAIVCQDFTLVLGEDGTGSITPGDLLDRDLGDCPFTYSVSQSDFVCSDEGENLVTVTAVDADGNELSCTATVTVVVPEGILSIDYGADCRQVYHGYGPASCTDITASVSGGHGPYSYEWSTGETTSSITVCPESTTDYYVTATDSNGCTEVAGPIQVLVVDVSCGHSGNKVLICHIPPGNPENAQTNCVAASSVPAHLAHGDFLGDCSVTADPCAQPFMARPGLYADFEDVEDPVLWPNPGTSDIHLDLPHFVTGPVRVELRSSEGWIIRLLEYEQNPDIVWLTDLQDLATGVYHVKVTSQDGSIWSLKWIKFE